jgi:predicted oxidoreductase
MFSFGKATEEKGPRDPSAEPVLIVGGGLAGLVAAFELSRRRVRCIIIDQENATSLGGQAFWSLGGLFCVNSSDQRRQGIKDSRDLARADWFNSARFDRLDSQDKWPSRWADAFVDFAVDRMEKYVKARGISFLQVGWAERGDGRSGGHGNSVPRFHLTWGTGPEVVRVFVEPVKKAAEEGLVEFMFRHRVDEIIKDENGRAVGVRGVVLEPNDDQLRGVASSRKIVGDFELRGSAVLVSSGGIGGNVDKVKKAWPLDRLGPKVPENFVVGVPAHVDGRMIDITKDSGASVVNTDRMWHYTEGLENWNPIWPGHGIRVLPGPSSLWLDATGTRLPPPLFPGSDTLATLKHICSTGYDYSWFILDRAIIAREFALSGSEQNPDVTGKSYLGLLKRTFSRFGPDNVHAFVKHGKNFISRDNLDDLIQAMNELAAVHDGPRLDPAHIKKQIHDYNLQMANPYGKDAQLMLIHNSREYRYDRWTRVAAIHPLAENKSNGPLIAVRMNLLTRKTLGGIETDLDSRVLTPDGSPYPGLYAAGECAGFGGGGVHGYSALEGTFLGGCIFSGRAAGIAMAKEILGEEVLDPDSPQGL